MPYPVPPPSPPPVVSFLQPEGSTHIAPAAMTGLHSVHSASSRTVSATAPPEVLAENRSDSVSVDADVTPIASETVPSTKAAQLGTPIEVNTSPSGFDWKTESVPEIQGLASHQLTTLPAQAPQRSSLPSTVFIQRLSQSSSSPSPASEIPALEPVPATDPAPIAPTGNEATEAVPTSPATPISPATLTSPTTPTNPVVTPDVVELQADRQEYDSIHQVFTGIGHAQLRFRGALLTADRIQANLQNRIAVGEGNARLTRGSQIIEGNRFEYNFVQSEGFVLNARGEVFVSAIASDFSPNQGAADSTSATPPNTGIYSPGGLTTIIGDSNGTEPGGQVSRLRFEADRIDFTADGGRATNVRITNDPFSPPELELRTNTATFTRLSPTRSEIRGSNPRLVLDQNFTLPLLVNRIIIDNRQRDPSLVRFGYDQRDRGGFFVESPLELLATPGFQIQVRPQIFIQRALTESSSIADPANFGVVAQLSAAVTPTTALQGNVSITSFDLGNLSDNLRASLRARQRLPGGYNVALEYSYRDRLFNGSLGYQDVQSSLGFIVTSPTFRLGSLSTGAILRYQVGIQAITAQTDGGLLLSQGRFQSSAELSRYFPLWTGQPLPATATEGLRYTPNVLVPSLGIAASVRGVVGVYTGGDSQETLSGSVGLYGQFGHFSRQFLDYTAFNISFYQAIRGGQSPFLFDRDVDQSVLSLGLTQQIYGPFRVGFQTAISLDNNRSIDTTYTLEYSRRTFAITLRYNPIREVGSLGLRINDFNWGTEREPFSGSEGTVFGGVRQSSD